MKKSLYLLIFFFLINATTDSENIIIDLDRTKDSNISFSWKVLYNEYDSINVEISHDGKIEKYELPLKESSIELCCYEGEVTVTLNVIITKVLQLSNEECSAASCLSFTKETFSNQVVLSPIPTTTTSTTTTSTTTTSTTTTTIPPPIQESTNFLDIEIKNELITSIPLFDEIDLTDQEKNSIAFIITTSIIVLFYLVLLLQEWFNKIISNSRIRFFRQGKDIRFIKVN